MAFDLPIEADEVGDLNLVSVLRRAPVIGTVMWILGGDMAKQREDEEQKKKLELDMYATSCNTADSGSIDDASLSISDVDDCSSDASFPTSSKQLQHDHQQQQHLKNHPLHVNCYGNGEASSMKQKGDFKRLPRLLGSDISDFGECAIQEEEAENNRIPEQRMESNDSFTSLSTLKKSKKTMSWSDEAGRSLVEYAEENQSVNNTRRLEASSALSSASAFNSSNVANNSNANNRPLKSALKRTKSMRNNSNNNGNINSDQSRYLPKGLGVPQKGLIMPTYHRSKSTGYVSPEYGFYINITPPSPEMYCTNSNISGGEEKYNDTFANNAINDAPSQPTILSNPAFSKGRNKVMNWPSVPL